MKKLILVCMGLFAAAVLLAQSPAVFNYQAVVRDVSGAVKANRNVNFRINILQGSASGTSVFGETHSAKTNEFGLVNLEIGNGNNLLGNLANIDWGSGPYFLKVELDPGDGIYILMGTTQLLSVPYALHAGSAANGFSGNYNDLTNKPTFLNHDLYTTATGFQVLSSNTGTSNTAMGYMALGGNTAGYSNVAFGHNALQSNNSGFHNTAIGYQAGISNTEGHNNVFIGSSAGYYETGSNRLIIDNQLRANETDARQKALIYGEFAENSSNQMLTFNGVINAGRNRILNLGEPTSPHDATTKEYVDNLLSRIEQLESYFGIDEFVNDCAGNLYKAVKIGTQIWMAENLRTSCYNDLMPIPLVEDGTEWLNLTSPGYCWYNNDEVNTKTYGALYNWYAVETGKLCPKGWHVPNDDEWTMLTDYLINNGYGYGGNGSGIGKSMASTSGWADSNQAGDIGNNQVTNNSSGFNALPGGCRGAGFVERSYRAYFWSSSGSDSSYAWYRSLNNDEGSIIRFAFLSLHGFSIRCLKD